MKIKINKNLKTTSLILLTLMGAFILYSHPSLANELEGKTKRAIGMIWSLAKTASFLGLGLSAVLWNFGDAERGAYWAKKSAIGVAFAYMGQSIVSWIAAI